MSDPMTDLPNLDARLFQALDASERQESAQALSARMRQASIRPARRALRQRGPNTLSSSAACGRPLYFFSAPAASRTTMPGVPRKPNDTINA